MCVSFDDRRMGTHTDGCAAYLPFLVAVDAAGGADPGPARAEAISGPGFRMDVSFPASSRPVPAVILMPGCSGGRPPAVAAGLRAHARALVAKGFAAAVIDVLSPRGRSSICTDLSALRSMEGSAASAAEAAARILSRDRRIDGSRVGFIGQSFGGSVALRLASRAGPSRPFRAVRGLLSVVRRWLRRRRAQRFQSADHHPRRRR